MKQFILTLDRGNTAIKAALWTADGSMSACKAGDESLPAANLVMSMVDDAGISLNDIIGLAWCTVVASFHAEDEASLKALGIEYTIELNANTVTDLTIGYETPQSLGADRLAAVLGAIAIVGDTRPILVADIGTAVTYEFIDAGRIYTGGNIAPGIDMRLRALAAFTDALPAVKASPGEIPMWGQSTAQAMRAGAVRGIVAELEYYRAAAAQNAIAVITGGSAQLLVKENILNFDYIHDPFLVHKGLYSIIKK